jgi:4,5-dihydroxyphthalate decarboxylase
MSAHPPEPFETGHPDIVRLFPDYQKAEEEYYLRTKIFPIMHVIAIRKDVLEKNPWAAVNLFTAFEKAKERSVYRALEMTASRYPIPWAPDTADKRLKIFGNDFFPYGIDNNRHTLEAFLRWCYEQGVAQRHLKVEELFPVSLQGKFKI